MSSLDPDFEPLTFIWCCDGRDANSIIFDIVEVSIYFLFSCRWPQLLVLNGYQHMGFQEGKEREREREKERKSKQTHGQSVKSISMPEVVSCPTASSPFTCGRDTRLEHVDAL